MIMDVTIKLIPPYRTTPLMHACATYAAMALLR